MPAKSTEYGRPHIFKHYRKQMGGTISKPALFAKVLLRFLELQREMVLDGTAWKLPYNLGILEILIFRPEIEKKENGVYNLPIDWPSTRKMWGERPELKGKKFIYYLNEHSNGYIAHLFYMLTSAYYRHKTFYSFEPIRSFNRAIARKMFLPASLRPNYYVYEKWTQH